MTARATAPAPSPTSARRTTLPLPSAPTTTRDRDPRVIDAHVGNGDRDTELTGEAERPRDEPTGARLVARVVGLVEEHGTGGEIGCPGGEPERRRRPGRSRADDDDLAPLHAGALSAPGQRAPPSEGSVLI